MNIEILQWGLFTFMMGLILSLPLAAVHYSSTLGLKTLFTNPRKLKSAHLDFLMQAFSLGLVYSFEFAMKTEVPLYAVIPLIFGAIGNPIIFLLESIDLHRSGITTMVYRLLKATSPVSLLFAWSLIGWTFLPDFLKLLLCAVILIGLSVILIYIRKSRQQNVHHMDKTYKITPYQKIKN